MSAKETIAEEQQDKNQEQDERKVTIPISAGITSATGPTPNTITHKYTPLLFVTPYYGSARRNVPPRTDKQLFCITYQVI
ncbi:MAG: hypothetical protein M1119_06110 [Firmicutes bacterium]|nr:hypothetical protein [Bacillota bacterium]